MSNKNQETIADIVFAMRNEGHTGEASCLEWIRAKMTYYADRIEAAAKREREAGAEAAQICGEIGEVIGRGSICNAAKMREALQRIANMGEQIDYRLGSSEETVYALRYERCLAHNISECARAAKSRNKKTKTITNNRKQCKSPKTCDRCKTWKRDGKTCVGTCPHQDGMTAEWMSGCPFFS